MTDIHKIMEMQRAFFRTGKTRDVAFRIDMLQRLYFEVSQREKDIADALNADLGKSPRESYMCETGLILSEITYMIRHLPKFASAKRVHTPLAQFPAVSYEKPCPYGTVLIMSPWNYPLLLTLEPLVDALAAGNTAVVKPSAYAPASSEVIKSIIENCFSKKYVACVTGGRKENQALLDKKFDMIFFTGSGNVGREVLRKCAGNLTPVVLELGGKSPCIVDSTANLSLAAKRIVFGKFLNCGQTCVAPDYIFCDRKIQNKLIGAIKRQIRKQFGKDPISNPDYGKIINRKHYDRILGLIDPNKVVGELKTDEKALKIAPTVMRDVTFKDRIMSEEIFGPVLPVIAFDDIGEIFEPILARPKPLALYIFSRDRDNIRRIRDNISYGGGCVNDTIIHLATSEMGFGGVGDSGQGAYHGRAGFEAFSHKKSIVEKSLRIDLPMRYQPYRGKLTDKLIRFFLR